MSRKTSNNKLPSNLPQLQNLIKRDSDSYRDEFLQQYRHYQSHMEVFRLQPSKFVKTLNDLITFLAQVAQCYKRDLESYPQELCELLQSQGVALEPGMRMTIIKALILMRSKNLIPATKILELFFKLFRCQDKVLRKTLYNYIITDIKTVNLKHRDAKLNSTLQNFMYTMLRDNNHTAAKMSLDVMIDLYKRNIWNTPKVVNVISNGCLSKVTKILVPALNFFIGHNDDEEEEDDEEGSDAEGAETRAIKPDIKKAKANLKIGKKTRKRLRKMDKQLKLAKKSRMSNKAENFNFSALHLLHDPQDFAEKLFSKLQTTNERFEVKLMMIDLISRLIGIHQLIICNFYSFLSKFLNPRQKEVTKLLLFAAQASHPLVPPDIMEDLLKTIANNFITERNLSDAIAVGLNTTREICSRCPLSMTEELLQDLVQYKSHKVKSVVSAARSLLQLFRESDPEKLRRKDRGKPTEAMREVTSKLYGEIQTLDYIPGVEALSYKDVDDSDSDSDDVSDVNDDDEDNDGVINEDAKDDDAKSTSTSKNEDDNEIKDEGTETDAAPRLKAQAIMATRILTQAEFRQIHKRQMMKQLRDRPGKKRKLITSNGELPNLSAIENLQRGKRQKHERKDEIESQNANKEEKEKATYHKERSNPYASTTNKEKRKSKNFLMMRPKANERRNKRSFREKQVLLRDNLLRRAKLRRKKRI